MVGVLVVLLAGCTPQGERPVTVESSATLEEIEAATEELFRYFNGSWGRPRDGVSFILEHNHPDLGFDRSDFACFTTSSSLRLSLELQSGSMEPDPSFVVPMVGSSIDGKRPDGQVYGMLVRLRIDEGGRTRISKEPGRVVVLDGRLYMLMFAPCKSLGLP